MEASRKRQEFLVQIRRKNLNNQIMHMRSRMQTAQTVQVANHLELLTRIASGQLIAKQHKRELKILSWHESTVKDLYTSNAYLKIYSSMLQPQLRDQDFNDYLTVLINMCAYLDVQLPAEIMQTIAVSILNQSRQMLALWLLANIIYKQNNYSQQIARELVVNCEATQFMGNRLLKKFKEKDDIIKFNYFCCSFLVVSPVVPDQHLRAILQVIQELQKFEDCAEDNFWYFSEAFVDHGGYIGLSHYEIFGASVFQRFHRLCKQKKTKFVRNYLKGLLNFTKSDAKAYPKLLKHHIFEDFNYCLENRFPQIHRLCAQIGSSLIRRFQLQVDLENIHFFSSLSTMFLNYERYALDVQVSLLTYSSDFFTALVGSQVTDSARQVFVEQVLKADIMGVLAIMIRTSQGNCDILNPGLDMINAFLRADTKHIILQKCLQTNIVEDLSLLNIHDQKLYKRVQELLNFCKA